MTSGARQLAPGECRRVDGLRRGNVDRGAVGVRSSVGLPFPNPRRQDVPHAPWRGTALPPDRRGAACSRLPSGRPRSWWRLRLRRPPPAAVTPATSACGTSPATTAGCTSTRARISGLTTTTSRTPTRTPSRTTTPSRRSITAPPPRWTTSGPMTRSPPRGRASASRAARGSPRRLEQPHLVEQVGQVLLRMRTGAPVPRRRLTSICWSTLIVGAVVGDGGEAERERRVDALALQGVKEAATRGSPRSARA